MNITNTKQLLESLNSPQLKFLISLVFITLCLIAFLYIKEHFDYRARTKNNSLPMNKLHEVPATLTMGLDELIEYFKSHYNFNISQDSFKLVEKAKNLLERLEALDNQMNLDLLALQTGVMINKDEIVDRINQAGYLSSVVGNELDLMVKLFSYLKDSDETYEDELSQILNIRNTYMQIERRVLQRCMSLITEFPTST